ncbi:hypothetical protein CULT_830034 [[Clostridium] ultunense Esp]|nr:hypothetical protein CULT_830034 [[Clostridium] ultunense Esp]
MNPHERQYFNLLLAMAVERFCERIIQRNEGAENALYRSVRIPRETACG